MYCFKINVRKPRIIIFDDDTMVLDILNDYFSLMSFEVQSFNQVILCPVCENTNSCVNPCADIIITDFEMPRVNGIELLRHQAQRKCPINIKNKAIMSGVLPDKYIDKMEGLADNFFKKPFSLSEVAAWSRVCLSRVDLSQPNQKSTFHEIYLDC